MRPSRDLVLDESPAGAASAAERLAAYDACPSLAGARLQKLAGWIFLAPFCGFLVCLIRFVGRYRIDNLEQARADYRALAREGKPLLICMNHLTFIDSALAIWAFGSNFWYLTHYSKFPWNLPAGDFFKKKFSFRVVAYLTKCLFIHRDGTRRHRASVLELCRKLLDRGEVVMIFPEGTRSRSGKFELERLTYGAGKLCLNVKDCRVLCVYLRGENQQAHSNYPERGSRFRLQYRVIEPRTDRTGREGYRALTLQIAREIKAMEERSR